MAWTSSYNLNIFSWKCVFVTKYQVSLLLLLVFLGQSFYLLAKPLSAFCVLLKFLPLAVKIWQPTKYSSKLDLSWVYFSLRFGTCGYLVSGQQTLWYLCLWFRRHSIRWYSCPRQILYIYFTLVFLLNKYFTNTLQLPTATANLDAADITRSACHGRLRYAGTKWNRSVLKLISKLIYTYPDITR